MKHNGKYDEAKRYFSSFYRTYRPKNFYKAKAKQEILACDVAKQIVRDSFAEDQIKIAHLGDSVNTPYSEFAAHQLDGELMYSSLAHIRKRRKGEKRKKGAGDRIISKVMVCNDGISSVLDPIDVPSDHIANSSYVSSSRTLFFTQCVGTTSDSLRCDLYVSKRSLDGSWSTPFKLPKPINSTRYSSTQPYAVYDSLKKTHQLFFVSNRAGGFGNYDIWKVDLNEKYQGRPVNVGSVINSKDAEGTPYYDIKAQRLYFSSRWHAGLGGYDIFYSDGTFGTFSEPVNLGVPFNSAANDLYYVMINDSMSYFSSNREGSKNLTEESCCNDIYQIDFIDPIFEDDDSNEVALIDTPDLITVIDTTRLPSNDTVVLDTPLSDSLQLVFEDSIIEQEVTILLPISLYFHNDEPDSNTLATTTQTSYQDSYEFYYSLLPLYKIQYAKQFPTSDQETAKDTIEHFFYHVVKSEYERSIQFLIDLTKALDKGKRIELTISGFTSPRNTSVYNTNLASRRVHCIENYILQFNNGVLKKYVDSNQLKLNLRVVGERESSQNVSDSDIDTSNSIYSVGAAKERRAEITSAKLIKY